MLIEFSFEISVPNLSGLQGRALCRGEMSCTGFRRADASSISLPDKLRLLASFFKFSLGTKFDLNLSQFFWQRDAAVVITRTFAVHRTRAVKYLQFSLLSPQRKRQAGYR